MRKVFTAALASSMLAFSAETEYSVTDLQRIIHEHGDHVYVSANGWLYSADVYFGGAPERNITFITGFDNKGRYPELENAPVNDPRIKSLFIGESHLKVEDLDVISSCTGTVLGDEDRISEYFGFRGMDTLAGEQISPEYRNAYAKIVNDIATAIRGPKK